MVRFSISNILFITTAPQSVGHRYRVINHAEAFERLGLRVCIVESTQVQLALSKLSDLSAVIIFRPIWSEEFELWCNLARERQIPVFVDLDDLTFDLDCQRKGEWSYWLTLSAEDKQHWHKRFLLQRRALLQSDGAIVSTMPLANNVRSLGLNAFIWPNGFNRESWTLHSQARKQRHERKKLKSSEITIGYASGTPTHAEDFNVVVPALSHLLQNSSNLHLCIVGDLDISAYHLLSKVRNQIVQRPLVPYVELPFEYARFDINLAPLEMPSRFCEAKSELKFFEAAASGVSTVASPTPPYAALIKSRRNGCLAQSTTEWVDQISWLAASKLRRRRLARRAFHSVRSHCSPNAQVRDAKRILHSDFWLSALVASKNGSNQSSSCL